MQTMLKAGMRVEATHTINTGIKKKGKKIKGKIRKRDTHSHSPVDSLG